MAIVLKDGKYGPAIHVELPPGPHSPLTPV
jgi:hypothetical protein